MKTACDWSEKRNESGRSQCGRMERGREENKESRQTSTAGEDGGTQSTMSVVIYSGVGMVFR
jgi:hypothetical protein